jgi:hypothetical protein
MLCDACQDKFATHGLQEVQANIDRITCGYQLPCLALILGCV